jgi:hypothetical protein
MTVPFTLWVLLVLEFSLLLCLSLLVKRRSGERAGCPPSPADRADLRISARGWGWVKIG